MKSNYKRLGDYIRQVDVRNKDLAVDKLLGLSISKQFIPSIANTIGTDMSNYKVVQPRQFGYVPVTSRNGDKITIALYKEECPCIISQAYVVFEVIDETELLPEYLMMWFSRPEFDRYARFKSHGSAREIFEWDEMCNVLLPVPPIEEQRKIVAEYQAIEQRIESNRRLIATLEETAQTIYRKMFVDDIDPENLPEGWRMGTIGEIATISSGKTCKDKIVKKDEEHVYPVAGASGIIGYSSEYNQYMRILTTGRVGTLGVINRYNEPIYCADNVLVVESNLYEYTYQILSLLDYTKIQKGGVQSLVTQTDLYGG
ncbi:restriction endonuclease subunit S [Xylanibacter rodentium]|uniref:restriction endonuclease subunit S n=1 Tax=Xylanibacter rodentium TaxID=2736289 RepID=UPI002586EC89|nr:restriction endonuclease subunit S [Xylanibacter rodentium]